MKKIEDHLLAVFNTMSRNKEDWKYVTDEQKEKFFFIINRNLSKIFPKQSYLLNNKSINKSDMLDIWFTYLKNIPLGRYSKTFWSKVDKNDNNNKNISDNDLTLLNNKLKLKKNDILFLNKYYKSELDEELKYFKNIEKNN